MLKFLIKRLIQSIVVLFLLSIIIFALIHFMPGDIITQYKLENPGHNPSKQEIEQFKKAKGLDKHYVIQYINLMKRNITADFGRSERYQLEVSSILPSRIITTLKLTLPVFFLSLLIAIPLGIFTAVYQYTRFDYLVNIFIFIGISAPTFWIGLMLIYALSLKLQLFPASGVETIGISSIVDQAKHLILPIFVLSIHRIGSWVRYFRGSLLEILNMDYIRTARAKGLNEDKVIFKHALKNALIPLLTLVALSIPHLISGTLITEQIFGISGMGQLLLNAIFDKDKEIAITAFLLLAVLTLIFNLIADLMYNLIDPRIK